MDHPIYYIVGYQSMYDLIPKFTPRAIPKTSLRHSPLPVAACAFPLPPTSRCRCLCLPSASHHSLPLPMPSRHQCQIWNS